MNAYIRNILVIITFAIAIAGSGIFVSKAQLAYKIAPRTFVASTIPVGLMSVKEVQKKLEEALDTYLNTPLSLIYEGKTQLATPLQLGVHIDLEKLFQNLPVIYQDTSLFDIPQLMLTKKNAEIPFIINERRTIELIQTLLPESVKASNNAHFSLLDSRKLAIIPEHTGEKINIELFIDKLRKNVSHLASNPLLVATNKEYPVITQFELASSFEDIKRKIESEVMLKTQEKTWEISMLDHPEWISFDYNFTLKIPQDDRRGESLLIPVELPKVIPARELPLQKHISVEIKIAEKELSAYLQKEIASAVNIPSQDVHIEKNEEGMFIFNGSATHGRQLNSVQLTKLFTDAVNNNISTIEIPIEEVKAQVDAPPELEKLGVRELIGVGYSAFYGSPASRNHNIKVGIARYNGLLIKPGETVSFNEYLGPVDEEHGFKKELTIVGNDTRPEFGGGLCQVSSTFFRAILNTGLPYTERYAHSYAVRYYFNPSGPGLDATIYPGDKDVKFINDTPGHIIIQAYLEGEEAYFKFYGTNDKRQVIMDGSYTTPNIPPPPDVIVYSDDLPPGEKKKLDSAHEGFDATWYRTVLYPHGEEKKDIIQSHYRPWPAKYLVGKEKIEEAPQ